MKSTGKFFLFLSSFAPAVIIILLYQIPLLLNTQITPLLVICTIFLLMTAVIFFEFNKTYSNPNPEKIVRIKISKISSGSSEVATYLLTIVAPIISSQILDSINEWRISIDLVAFLILGFFLMIIYINSNIFIINPLFFILKFKLYKIEYELSKEGQQDMTIEGVLLTKNKTNIEQLDHIFLAVNIDEGIYYLGE